MHLTDKLVSLLKQTSLELKTEQIKKQKKNHDKYTRTTGKNKRTVK